jgi:hypothetical protein
MASTSKLEIKLNAELVKEINRLRTRMTRLEDWIRSDGERSDLCTFNILGEICGNCACPRKSQANSVLTHPTATRPTDEL